MDYKTLLDRIDWNENRVYNSLKELKELKEIITVQIALDNEIEPDVIKMFDEKFRILYALKLTKDKRRPAAKMLKMSERNLYRLMKEYKII